jgi:hypothetical protein
MALTAADLQSQLDTLHSARARGVLRVKDTSSTGAVTEVEYRSDHELAAAIADLERRLALMARLPIRTVLIATQKGT